MIKCERVLVKLALILCHEQGFCFIKYEDQRSTILAVDNFNGIQLLGRTLRVDHKDKYALPKEVKSFDGTVPCTKHALMRLDRPFVRLTLLLYITYSKVDETRISPK